MSEFICDSYCGLFCGACEILNAYRNSIAADAPAEWDKLPEVFKKHIQEADMKCYGCKTEIVFEGCQKCKIRECARKENVEFCFECNEYPCELINAMKERIRTFSTELPHTRDIIANLDTIKEMGKEKWIERERREWSCKECGCSITWYQRRCEECKSELPSKYR